MKRDKLIYLDSNIYFAIANEESISVDLRKEIEKRYDQGFIFPHSPAHAEEIVSWVTSKGTEIAAKVAETIEKYSSMTGLKPGDITKEEAIDIINQIPDRHDTSSIRKKLLDIISNNNPSLVDKRTKIVNEDIQECITRVVTHINANQFAEENQIYFMGRRNENSIRENFDKIGKEINEEVTFESMRANLKIKIEEISQIDPEKIFFDERVKSFIEKYKKHEFDKIKNNTDKQEVLTHSQIEESVNILMDTLESVGYKQEKKNSTGRLISRMHDITHAIYASATTSFVTSDIRLRERTKAVYHYLNIKTEVIDSTDFIRNKT